MTKRVVSLLMVVCLLFTVSVTAFATEDGSPEVDAQASSILASGVVNGTTYSSLKDALAAASIGDSVEVLDYDSVLIEPVEVPDGVSLVIPEDTILRVRDAGKITIHGSLFIDGALCVNGTGVVDARDGFNHINGSVQLMTKNNVAGKLTIETSGLVYSNDDVSSVLDGGVPFSEHVPHIFDNVTYANGWAYAESPSLGGLSVGSGTLDPVFKSDVLNYTLTVENETKTMWVLPSAANRYGINVNGNVVASGTQAGPLGLTVGTTIVNIDVYDIHNGLQVRYALAVTRKPAAVTPPTVEPTSTPSPKPVEYKISFDTVKHGKFTANYETCIEGTQVEITPVADAGYRLSGIVATSGSQSVDLVSLNNGKYAFRMPKGNVSVSGTFEKIPLSFKDVKQGQWFYDSVMDAARMGWVAGAGNGKFNPSDTMRRGDFCIVMARIDGANLDTYHVSRFKDVPENSYYMKAIAYCADKGYVSGVGNGKFAPNDSITREQMAKIIAKSKNLVLINSPIKTFNDDAKISGWARDSVYACLNAKILVGDNGGNVNPLKPASRAEATAMLVRAFG